MTSNFKVGSRVVCNGYAGTVTEICAWSDSLVEVRVPGGLVCVPSGELKAFPGSDVEYLKAFKNRVCV